MSDGKGSSAINLNSEESWTIARSYSNLLNPVPWSISSGVAALWAEHRRQLANPGAPTDPSVFSALRLFQQSTKLKVPLYFAASELYPEKFGELQEDNAVKALLLVLGPGLFAALLAMVFLHRRLNKIMDPETWANMSKEMVLNMELGFLVGSAVPKLGPAEGTLAAGIRYPALATLLLRTPDHFRKYRVAKKRQVDIEFEHSIWRCDHSQIAAYILKDMGLSLDLRKNSHALRKLDDDQLCTLTGELSAWRYALRFVDAIKAGKPIEEHATALKLTSGELAALKEKTDALFGGKSQFGWMFRQEKAEPSSPDNAVEDLEPKKIED